MHPEFYVFYRVQYNKVKKSLKTQIDNNNINSILQHTRISSACSLVLGPVASWHGILAHADAPGLNAVAALHRWVRCHELIGKHQLHRTFARFCCTPSNGSQHSARRWRSLSQVGVGQLGLSVENNQSNIIGNRGGG